MKYAHPAHRLVTSQLGFRPDSPKTITFIADEESSSGLPESIPFYITKVGKRRQRTPGPAQPPVWSAASFPFPIDISTGKYAIPDEQSLYRGSLVKRSTAWGTFWQAEFSDFTEEGVFQIENEYAFTVPFTIETDVYGRLERGYLVFLNSQRSGVEIPGVRPMLHADDGRLDSDGSFHPAAGGWYDAGDWRKWLSLTQGNIEALALLIRKGHPGFKEKALDELRWGNRYFQSMIAPDGQVYEDVGGGELRFGYTYDAWWLENHPGAIAGDSRDDTDGIPGTGDERMIRVHYNQLVQYQFVRCQMVAYQMVEPHEKGTCLHLAERAWQYGRRHSKDRRTLFIAEELLAALELSHGGSNVVTKEQIDSLVRELLSRQETHTSGLSGYFMEENSADGYRSVAFSCEPVMALLRFLEMAEAGTEDVCMMVKNAVTEYADMFLLSDAKSNPFGYTPYGVYVDPPYPEYQTFRPTGVPGRSVRSFIHLFAKQQMPHGTGATLMHQAYFLAKAGKLLGRRDYRSHAEKLIQWTTGHNPAGLCLATGVGFRHPVPANFVAYRIPEAMVVGFIGYPDDSPYMETSNAVEWSTQEIWDVPFAYTIGAIEHLR